MELGEIKLRPYQLEAIEVTWKALFRSNTALLVMCTGLGKTLTIAGFCEKAFKAKPSLRVLFLVNKVSLAQQTSRVFSKLLEGVGVFCGSLNSYSQERFTVASVQSIAKADIKKFDLLIVDEAHRLDQREGSQYMQVIEKLRDLNSNLKIVGLTATPFRNDGYIFGPDKIFENITYSKDIMWAIDQGWLVKPSMKHTTERFVTSNLHTRMGDFDSSEVKALTLNKPKVEQQIEDAMPKLEGRRKVIWHCSCIEHAELVADTIPEEAIVIHSKMNIKQRREELSKFEDGDVRHLCFVMIVSEGYDYPPIDAVVLMRPTKSPVLYVQCIGRALRTAAEKDSCLVLDYGEVILNCGPLDRPYVKEAGSRSRVKPTDMKFCPKCLEYLETKIVECPSCGHSFKKEIDYMKKLSTRAKEGKLFSDKTQVLEWIEVNPDRSNVSVYESKAGNTCLKFTFRPNNILSTTASYNKFVIIESSNKFLDGRAPMIVRNIVGEIVSARTAEDYERVIVENNMLSRIYKIQVDRRGKYPDITGFKRYEATAQRA